VPNAFNIWAECVRLLDTDMTTFVNCISGIMLATITVM